MNLLPPQEQRELFFGEKKRLIIILGIVISASLVSLILILFSINIFINGEVESQKFTLEQARKEYDASNSKNLKEIVQKYNKILTQIDNFYEKKIYLTDILEEISKIERPEGLYLTNISLNRDKKDNKVVVAITGFSKTRENLLSFKDGMEKDFENISFSSSSWTSPIDIDFNLTFEFVK